MIHYLLGTFEARLGQAPENLVPLMKQNAVLFGASNPGREVTHNRFGKYLMNLSRKKTLRLRLFAFLKIPVLD